MKNRIGTVEIRTGPMPESPDDKSGQVVATYPVYGDTDNATKKDALSIMTKITFKAAEYVLMTGKEPNSVYLGREEFSLLKEWVHNYGCYLDVKEERYQIDGMAIFLVDADHHLNCGE